MCNKLQAGLHYTFVSLYECSSVPADHVHISSNRQLKNVEAGAVSVSHDGSDIAISLGKSLTLDETHQVRWEQNSDTACSFCTTLLVVPVVL